MEFLFDILGWIGGILFIVSALYINFYPFKNNT